MMSRSCEEVSVYLSGDFEVKLQSHGRIMQEWDCHDMRCPPQYNSMFSGNVHLCALGQERELFYANEQTQVKCF